MVRREGFEPSIATLKGWRPGPLDDGRARIDSEFILLEERGARLAGHLVLRARATGATDRADQLALFHEWNPTARSDDAIESRKVVEAVHLNTVLEYFRLAAELRRCARLVLRDLDRRQLRPIHP